MLEPTKKPPRGRPRNAQAKYDAAGNGRRIKAWNPPASGPNKAITGASKIRDRSRDAVRNDWSGESSVQKWTTTLVGVGIVPRWAKDDLNQLWTQFARRADADGVLDVYGMQALAVRSWIASGEVFVRRRPRSLKLGLPVPLQLQLIESDFCPYLDTDARPGMPEGNRIRQGIELTKYGERAAYWFYKEHPGDKPSGGGSSLDLIRVPASEVVHLYEPPRPGALRGVSLLAPVLVRLRSTTDFEDAVLDRQKLANLFTLFITRAMPEDWEDIDTDPDTGLPKWYGADGQPMAGLEPGISQQLAPGEDVKFANPPEAGVGFSDYLRSTNLGTAAGQGLPYELFSGDIANVSDRAMRIVIQEFRRFAEQRQWHAVIPMLCQPVVEWFASAAVLAGLIAPRRLSEAQNPEHSPHGWDYIHPVQDVQGKILAIEAGLSSRTRAITSRGDDPKQIDKERLADQEREKGLGIQPKAPVANPTPPTPNNPGNNQAQALAAAMQALAIAAQALSDYAKTQ